MPAFHPALLAGKFVVFDGPDGCGKTTQLEILTGQLTKAGVPFRRLREPGGTFIGEQIRELLLTSKGEGMDLRCEMLLYMASRAQLVEEQIKPALAAGEAVLTDRYLSSTLAYQGAAGGLPIDSIQAVAEASLDGVYPHLTLIFDISTEAAMARLNPKSRSKAGATLFQPSLFADRIEQRGASYHERVRFGFLDQIRRWPERYRQVDASKPIPVVQEQVSVVLSEFFGPR